MPIHDPAGDISFGKWRLPLYKTPTDLNVIMPRVAALTAFTEMELVLRIGEPSDEKAVRFKVEDAAL